MDTYASTQSIQTRYGKYRINYPTRAKTKILDLTIIHEWKGTYYFILHRKRIFIQLQRYFCLLYDYYGVGCNIPQICVFMSFYALRKSQTISVTENYCLCMFLNNTHTWRRYTKPSSVSRIRPFISLIKIIPTVYSRKLKLSLTRRLLRTKFLQTNKFLYQNLRDMAPTPQKQFYA